MQNKDLSSCEFLKSRNLKATLLVFYNIFQNRLAESFDLLRYASYAMF